MPALFDPVPLSFIAGLTIWALSLSLLLIFRTPRTYPGFSLWTLSAFCMGASGVLMGLRGVLPAVFSIVAGNVLGVLGAVLILRGLGRFFDRPPPVWHDLSFLLLITLTQVFFYYVHPSMVLRCGFISLAFAALLLHSAALVHTGCRRLFPEDGLSALTVVLALSGGFHVLRAATMLFLWRSPITELDHLLFGAALLFMNPGTIMVFIGLLALHSRRMAADLAASKQEIRTLTGLLPICCICKKIRLESSAWQSIDVYVREHSHAEFTHGICPECMETHYPE